MIDDVYEAAGQGIGRSLFADDGALWKRGRNVKYVVKQMQDSIQRVEQRAFQWGFKFSIGKTNSLFFTKKKVGTEMQLYLYGKELKRVDSFKFIGVWFDGFDWLTWKVHIDNVNKCKKVLNVMRCVVGTEWGADRSAPRAVYVDLISLVLDYGSVAYMSESKTLLRKLDVL